MANHWRPLKLGRRERTQEQAAERAKSTAGSAQSKRKKKLNGQLTSGAECLIIRKPIWQNSRFTTKDMRPMGGARWLASWPPYSRLHWR